MDFKDHTLLRKERKQLQLIPIIMLTRYTTFLEPKLCFLLEIGLQIVGINRMMQPSTLQDNPRMS